jgi:glutamate-1-semialdehyde aminotransferase
LVNEKDIGIIKMEVERSHVPKNNFLQKVRSLADKKKIILIFDECTSGFRETFGGINKKYGIDPDLAMFGKTLGNGYAITAVIGRKEVMEAAQDTFISSTFWTERIGPTAALKTLDVMEKTKSWERITSLGNKLRNGWLSCSKRQKVKIITNGIPALSTFNFQHKDSLKFKTFLTQEFLKRGYLASSSFYSSTEHSEKIINDYLEIFEEIMSQISDCISGIKNIDSLIEGPVASSGFKRLN